MGNANRVVFIVVGVLLAATLALVVGSGSCSAAGGGGGGGAVPTSSGTSSSEVSAVPAENTKLGTADEDMTIEEFRQLLEEDVAPTGDNARNVASSPGVESTAETYESFAQRGFTDVELTADFDVNGTYVGVKTLEKTSTEKYPSYMTYYQSATGVLWIIYCNDSNYMAVPLGDASGLLTKEIILCESDYVTQYDADTNEYSEFLLTGIPNAAGVKVPVIDKSTLDSYAMADLEKM